MIFFWYYLQKVLIVLTSISIISMFVGLITMLLSFVFNFYTPILDAVCFKICALGLVGTLVFGFGSAGNNHYNL